MLVSRKVLAGKLRSPHQGWTAALYAPAVGLGSNRAEGTVGARHTGFAVEAYGVCVDVDVRHCCGRGRCAEPALAELTQALLPPGAVTRLDGTNAAARFTITCVGDRFTLEAEVDRSTGAEGAAVHSSTAPHALHALDGAIRTAVALASPRLVFVHAGAVAVEGRAIVLPGHSMAGKTTLVAALVRAGATYLSDEYAVLAADGLVHPYPRRLSVRGPGGRREVPVSALDGRAATGPLPVALVASLTYRPDATWSVRPTDDASGAEALIANAVAARIRPTEVLHAAGTVARAATHLAGERGDATLAADAILTALSTA